MNRLQRYRDLEVALCRLRRGSGQDDPPGSDAILDDLETLWEQLSDTERQSLRSEAPATWPSEEKRNEEQT